MAAAADPMRLIRTGWRRLVQDRSGSAAVEFALTTPILLVLFLGMCDVAPTLMAKFKIVSGTQSMADLAAMSSTMTLSDIVNLFAAGGEAIAPFTSAGFNIRISNIASDGNNNLFIYWSCGQGMTPFPARSLASPSPSGTQLNVLATLTAPGRNTSYIMVETSYTYVPPAGFLLRAAQTMTSVAYTLPRVSTYVGIATSDPNYVPPLPTATANGRTQTQANLTCLSAI